MSVSVIRSAKLEGSTGTTSTVTITAPTPGNSLFVQVSLPTANVAGITFSDPLNGAWPAADFFQTGLYGSLNYYYFRKSNIPNAPTSLSVSGTGSFTATFEYVEVSGADNTNPFVSSFGKTALSGGVSQATHVATATTTNTNDFVMLGISTSNGRTISAADGGYSIVQSEAVGTPVHLLYLADAGAVGAKATTATMSANASAYGLGVIYKAAKPAVTSVSSPSVTEGGNLVFTVTLASPTSGTTGYTAVLAASGTYPASLGSDLAHTLATATYSNGVTFASGSYSVPSSISSWTTTIGTVDDALDEYDETFTLTVDGTVSGTGTILDNDPFPNLTFSAGTENFGVVPIVATLDAVSGRDITFNVSTVDAAKTAGVDFTGLTNVPVTILAGNLSATVPVTVL